MVLVYVDVDCATMTDSTAANEIDMIDPTGMTSTTGVIVIITATKNIMVTTIVDMTEIKTLSQQLIPYGGTYDGDINMKSWNRSSPLP